VTASCGGGPTAPAHELFRQLAALLNSARTSRCSGHAIAVLDVDGMAEINYLYGRSAGDDVLARVSQALVDSLRSGEQAAWPSAPEDVPSRQVTE
jgi:GGDEF domain-containing protein